VPPAGAARGGPGPRGDREDLAEAVGIFAPYPQAEDKAHAFQMLDGFARAFLRNRRREVASPRRSNVIEDLGGIVVLADELARKLEELDETGREALRQVLGRVKLAERRPGGMIEVREGDRLVPRRYPDGSPARVFEPADLAGPHDRLSAWDGAPLWRRLRILSDLAWRARHLVPPDRGGSTSTFTERHGTAKGQLCRELGELLLRRAEWLGEPPAVSGGTKGRLYRAAAAIYAYATGADPEGAALERPVKDAARLLTRRDELQARWRASPDGPAEEIDEVIHQLSVTAKQLDAL
jgi:hypothetical protein